MHTMPYLIKNPAGTWCVQRKVPEKLQAAVARIFGGKKPTQVYLKKSLATNVECVDARDHRSPPGVLERFLVKGCAVDITAKEHEMGSV
jgi:hypothetical protein